MSCVWRHSLTITTFLDCLHSLTIHSIKHFLFIYVYILTIINLWFVYSGQLQSAKNVAVMSMVTSHHSTSKLVNINKHSNNPSSSTISLPHYKNYIKIHQILTNQLYSMLNFIINMISMDIIHVNKHSLKLYCLILIIYLKLDNCYNQQYWAEIYFNVMKHISIIICNSLLILTYMVCISYY